MANEKRAVKPLLNAASRAGLVCALLCASEAAGAALAGQVPSPVSVTLPQGLAASTTFVLPAGPQTKLVVVNALRIRNPSRISSLEIAYSRFSLYADDGAYYPVSPKTKSLIDALPEGSVGIGQATEGSLAFEVPAGVGHGVLNFYTYEYNIDFPSSY